MYGHRLRQDPHCLSNHPLRDCIHPIQNLTRCTAIDFVRILIASPIIHYETAYIQFRILHDVRPSTSSGSSLPLQSSTTRLHTSNSESYTMYGHRLRQDPHCLSNHPLRDCI